MGALLYLFYSLLAINILVEKQFNGLGLIIIGLIPLFSLIVAINYYSTKLQQLARKIYLIGSILLIVRVLLSVFISSGNELTINNGMAGLLLYLLASLVGVRHVLTQKSKNWAVGLSALIGFLVLTPGLFSIAPQSWRVGILGMVFIFTPLWAFIASRIPSYWASVKKQALKMPDKLKPSQLKEIIQDTVVSEEDRKKALSHLTSQEVLVELYESYAAQPMFQKEILNQITDEAFLLTIIKKASKEVDLETKVTLIGRFSDEEITKQVAENVSLEPALRRKAIKKIRNDDWHASFLKDKSQGIDLRIESLGYVKASVELLTIATDKDENDNLRTIVFKKIATPDLWKDLYTELPVGLVINEIDNLDENDIFLYEIVQNERVDLSVKETALLAIIQAEIPFDSDELLTLVLNEYFPRFLHEKRGENIVSAIRYFLHYYGKTDDNSRIRKLFPEASFLRWYRTQLPPITLKHEDDSLTFSETKNDFDHEIHYAAASILSVIPFSDAQKTLQRVWVSYENLIRRNSLKENHTDGRTEFEAEKEIAAGTLVRALAKCGAVDPTYQDFHLDNVCLDKLKQLDNQRKTTVRAFKGLAETREKILEEKGVQHAFYSKDFELITEQMKVKMNTIERLDDKIAETQTFLSPTHILKRIVADGQNYSNYIRQHATAGLKQLATNSFLNPQIQKELIEFLTPIDQNKKIEEEENFFEVSEMPKTNELGDPEVDVESITENNDKSQVKHSDPESEGYDAVGSQIRIFPYSSMGEILLNLKRGFEALDIEESFDHQYLKRITTEILEELPEAIPFLEQFPLKLMHPDQRKKMMGYYAESGLGFERWTRYTPPKDVGPVQKRYLRIRNLMTPNSMGLNYKLFRHPLLVLPVLYHEYLHYTGIKNEAEVWLKEHLFLRRLILKYAPLGEEYQFWIEFLSELEAAEDAGAKMMLSWPLENLQIHDYLNRLIRAIYGSTSTPQEAHIHTQNGIGKYELQIRSANMFLIWDPKVRWPSLLSKEGAAAREMIENIIRTRKQQNNFIDLSTYRNIIQQDENRQTLERWKLFMQKVFISHHNLSEWDFRAERDSFFNRV